MFKLIIEDDEGHTTVVPLVKEEITIGRKEGNTIRLTERNVSRHHARMVRANGSVFIEDLDSYNGVKVNGGRISARTSIREGDLVEIGDYHLALQFVSEVAPELPKTTPTPPPLAVVRPPTGSAATLRLPIEEKIPSPQALVAAAGPLESRTRTIAEDEAGRLVVLNTEYAGQIFLLTSTEMTIGRTEENTIIIPHRSVSSRHARIVYDGGVYRIIDLESANGVLVNGEEYARVDVHKGDVIELGHIKLRYTSPDEDIAAIVALARVDEMSSESPSVASMSLPTPAQVFDIREDWGMRIWFLGAIGLMVLFSAVGLWFLLRDIGDETNGSAAVMNPSQEQKSQPPAAAPAIEANDESGRSVEGILKQAAEKMKLGEWDSAEQVLQSVLSLQPNNKDALAMREGIQRELEAAVALKQAKAAIEKMEWDEAMDRLGTIGSGLRVSAEADAIRPEVKKKLIAYHLNKADKLEKSGKLPEVLKELDAVLVVDENNPVVAEKRDVIAKRVESSRKKPARSERSSEEPEIAGDESQARDFRQKGIDAYKKNLFGDAVKFYQLALKLNPRDSDLYRFLGSTYARMGHRERAYEAYKKYVQVCPKCPYTPPIRNIIKEYEEQK